MGEGREGKLLPDYRIFSEGLLPSTPITHHPDRQQAQVLRVSLLHVHMCPLLRKQVDPCAHSAGPGGFKRRWGGNGGKGGWPFPPPSIKMKNKPQSGSFFRGRL